MQRRKTLKLLSSLPLLTLFPSVVIAGDKKGAKLIDPKATMPNAMKYVHDASQSTMRTDKKANCFNCGKYNICMAGDKACKPVDPKDLKSAASAPCQMFAGGNVAKNGWCQVWSPKA